MIRHPYLPAAAALLGLAAGATLGNAAASRAVLDAIPTTTELTAIPEVPLPKLAHAGMALAARQAERHLEEGRPWAAWREVRGLLDDPGDAPDAFVLLGARAAAGWDGWSQVRRLLRGREGLEAERGEGRYLLGRAHQARGEWTEAAAAYDAYLRTPGAARAAEAAARLGAVHARAERHAEAAAAYALAAAAGGAARDWMQALEAEQRVRAGALTGPIAGGSAPARLRHARADAAARAARGDTAGAVARLAAERAALEGAGAHAQSAELALAEARLQAAWRRRAATRALLLRTTADGRAPAPVRVRAAGALGELASNLSAEEEMARAAAYEAGGRPGLAARSLRAAIRAGAPGGAAERLRLGRLLWEARDLAPARQALLDAAKLQTDPAAAAEAELLAARAAVRLARAEGWTELRRVPEQRPGTPAAGTALFLLGDAAKDLVGGIAYYRRAAEVTAAPEAREALFRLGDRRIRAGDAAGGLAAWEAYVARHPAGEATAEVAYRAGVMHERAGRAERAAALYRAAIAADPVSYYAVRAADRAGVDPLAAVLAGGQGWAATAADAPEAAAVLARLDALEAAGELHAWREELAWQAARLEGRDAALLRIAEELAARGHAGDAIRLGRELLGRRGGTWDERLLRLVFPLPHRALLEAEAERSEIDPYLLAGLVRQESSFDARARSRVGATGLGQIMPATGEWLARSAGATPFHPDLLTVPEVNLRMSAGYLRDQLRRYDGRRDLALAAYNAGPGRADRWRRELAHGGDPDRFRDAIPFTETRHYVKVVLRNAVVYRRLYGGGWTPGLTGGS